MGINEQIKQAKSLNELRMLAAERQPMASERTLRRRARLVKQMTVKLTSK